MPKFPYTPTPEEIAAVDPDSGPWEVEIIHRLFQYAPFPKVDEFGSGGFAFARNGDVVTLVNHEDFVKGLKFGAFVDPSKTIEDGYGEGPGDFGARPDLVEFVKEHKVDEVIAHAGSDPDMAQMLIDAENEAAPSSKGEPRKGVIHGLQAIIDHYLDPATPAGGGDGTLVAGGGEPAATDGDENGPEEEDTSEEE
jgi:hypothetical protein